MPDTISTTAPNARAALTAKPPAADLDTGAALGHAVPAENGLPR